MSTRVVVVIGGPAGSGKTTVGRALAGEQGWALIDSDEVRRDVHLVPRGTRLPSSAYSVQARHRIYAEIERRAAAAFHERAGVVVTATLLPAPERFLEDIGANRLVVMCHAPEAVLRERIAARPRDAASDASGDVAASQLRLFGQGAATAGVDLVIDTNTKTIAAVVREITARLRAN
ncbi:MAG: uncharacterized protein QOD83_1411 [Solirubrobacteraceae bacterium]|jgi:predicted kinase|nr:uncharacterized protein [Solirubrobacteraceae bacterium]